MVFQLRHQLNISSLPVAVAGVVLAVVALVGTELLQLMLHLE
jgi:hypothetical protein